MTRKKKDPSILPENVSEPAPTPPIAEPKSIPLPILPLPTLVDTPKSYYFVRLQTAVPIFEAAEPQYEFGIYKTGKYKVDSIAWGTHSVEIVSNGTNTSTPHANIVCARWK